MSIRNMIWALAIACSPAWAQTEPSEDARFDQALSSWVQANRDQEAARAQGAKIQEACRRRVESMSSSWASRFEAASPQELTVVKLAMSQTIGPLSWLEFGSPEEGRFWLAQPARLMGLAEVERQTQKINAALPAGWVAKAGPRGGGWEVRRAGAISREVAQAWRELEAALSQAAQDQDEASAALKNALEREERAREAMGSIRPLSWRDRAQKALGSPKRHPWEDMPYVCQRAGEGLGRRLLRSFWGQPGGQ